MNSQLIGIFDSGIGGLSILREVHRLLPHQDLLYLADQAHVPYGPRPLEEVRRLSFGLTECLLSQGAGLIIVACNTASAASLLALRQRFPATPFVGMEPAVKPAAENTRTRTVGVLATPATFQGALYASVVERFAEGVTVLQETLPGLVEQIERGEFDTPRTIQILEQGVRPLLAQGCDTLVLACTHFPFIIPALRHIAGGDVEVIDPSPAIARQAARVLETMGALDASPGESLIRYQTTGELGAFQELLARLDLPYGKVIEARWDEGQLRCA